jgi:dTDP-4-amino-4,6-dideoxygalactose transaminase
MSEDKRTIPLSASFFGEEEFSRLREAMLGRTAGDGPFCARVEARLSALLGVPRVLLTTSCTHALELALMALGIGPGQEVICPSFTFVSTANAALRVGAKPVFAEIDGDTLGLDPSDVERRIGPKTAAIIPVHYAGIGPDMDALLALASSRGLKVVEDAAQGLAASYKGRPLGALGDAGCFSFHETKNVICGEGGAIALKDPEFIRRAEIIREKGTNRRAFLRGQVDKYTWVAEGSSYILSDVLAAILDAQLDRLDEIQRRRAEAAARYRAGLGTWAEARGVKLPPIFPDRASNDHIFYLLLPEEALRDRVLSRLREAGIQAAFHYVPLHSSPFGQTLGPSSKFPVTDRIAGTLVRLPLHPRLTTEDIDRVVEVVKQAVP